ncbi:hypothetical protein [uncultured Shimia sp.]|uniref:hypothetical protein n=1 Tax=uncultured Shimia sp. TaxID=573152 RepID=UPI002604DDC7|nr:hypothetical protein [uncultured Shimia sp.]
MGQQKIIGKSLLRGAIGAGMVLSLVLVSGCNRVKNNRTKSEFAFDGIEFKASAKKAEGEDRTHFVSVVRKATQSLDGAKEAGRHAGTRYCIEQYGTSKIDWVNGPDQENSALTLDDETLIMEGYCKP